MSLRIHVSLPVSDLEASVAFYQRLFDVEVSKRRDDYANFRLLEPPIHLALNVAPADAARGADRSHFGVELENADALAAWTSRLRSAQQPLREEENVGCCYARGDKTWVADPDGHQWELWVRTGSFDKREAETGCCAPEASSEVNDAPAKSSCCS